jgi:hydroxymethylbilane synthase
VTTRGLRVGTRGSRLALQQTQTVVGLLESRGISSEVVVVTTTGDRLQDAGPVETGHKRLFVKELEDALLDNQIDLAVHSAKDMSVILPEGLRLAATLVREDPRDAIVLPHGNHAEDLRSIVARVASGGKVGTGSIRRSAQLAPLLGHDAFEPIRGNVDTRLRKLDDGKFAALVLACAGLRRLGLADRISLPIPIEQCIPAPGQGIVALEIREGDDETRRAIGGLGDAAAGEALAAERALVAALGGGCQLPLGAIALRRNADLDMHAVVASPDGSRIIRRSMHGPSFEPEKLGRRLAEALAADGAPAILDELR